ncbi:phosphoribosylglycinamide formyltransferase [Bacteroides ihuae]|uniref:phosphoribosylglycinamide formyltransferase n=1 Tax=Bacteroides ihuae TaxID=1852362 RepID=UPI0008DA26A9|nr:phosphoribosylglycinamide formyltransferase [Bacteroides ihuae]
MQRFAHFSLFCAYLHPIMKRNIAIFASGSGSNAENVIRYFKNNRLLAVQLVVSNKIDAFVLERAQRLDVPSVVFSKKEWESGHEILELLATYNIDFIVLAGFLLRISDSLLHVYPDKIINIHPSLLPKFGGKGMYGDKVHEAVVASGETESGITIHYINEHYDEGGVIYQATCPVLSIDTPADVAAKVHALEYAHYPRIIEEVFSAAAAIE